ncbi:MAG: glycoside hydrolase family 9 protein, partial [Verrucomicrobiota bacterium]
NPGTELVCETAASLAAASILFQNSNPTYAAELIEHAEALYAFGDSHRGLYSDSISNAAAFYRSWSGYQDELTWAAAWLYRATGKAAWLTKAEAEYQNLGNQAGTSVKSYKWTLAWDDKSFGCYVLMAMLEPSSSSYKSDAQRWLDYWSVGYNGDRITYTPGGLAWLDTWGALRYSANTAFAAFVYADNVADPSGRYSSFAASQINYMLGNNPDSRSYLCGFGNNPPINPHHRTAHGAWSNNLQGPPVNSRHVLYGALVGGPNASDEYTDDRGNYITNEVALDYNAGFQGALARMYLDNGGFIDPNFPQPEQPSITEFYAEVKINASGPHFTEPAIWASNRSAFPARSIDDMSARYFIDISEGIAAGYGPQDYLITRNGGGSLVVSDLLPWDAANHIYYVEVLYDGIPIYPGGASEYHKEAQIRISLPTSAPASAWDPTNDWSYQGLSSSLNEAPRIPVYSNGLLLGGIEPPKGDLQSYLVWTQNHFSSEQLANPAIVGPEANPDGDPFSNL